MTVRILQGDALAVLATLPANSVHCCVTSPPYYGLRDYGTAKWEGGSDPACQHVVGEIRTGLGLAKLGEQYKGGGHKQAEPKPMTAKVTCPHCGAKRVDLQVGLEATPDDYVARMVEIFREVRRVLRPDGVCWLNLGDSYCTKPNGPQHGAKGLLANHDNATAYRGAHAARAKRSFDGIKHKDLIGIPWTVAFALRADGWWLRSETIWHKPNPMPESCTDRPTNAHEQVFLLTKSADYFYDMEPIREGVTGNAHSRGHGVNPKTASAGLNCKQNASFSAAVTEPVSSRNARNVWTIASSPCAEAHFATMPPALAERCILAGTSAHGCCSACGAPYERVIEKGAPDLEHQRACGGDAAGEYHGQSTKGHAAAGVQDASAVKARILAGMTERRTIGWVPTCDCQGASVVRCTVLDPFSGAGTTAMVADRLGRHAIGVELNPDYIKISSKRITADAPLFASVEGAA